jgi:ankyrin repeat protein
MKILCLLLFTSFALLANDEFFEAARKGDTAALKAQLDKGVPVDSKWRYDQTALFMAARAGHLEAVKLLLERGANPDAKDSFYSMTALSGAAEKGNAELVKLLAIKGATGVDQVFTMAVGRKHAAIVKALVETGKVSASTMSNGMAAASATGATEVADMLKAAGAKPLEEAKVDAAVLQRYAGSYRGGPQNNEMKIDISDGRLRAAAFGQVIPLRAIDTTTFAPLPYPAIRITFKVEGENVNGLEFKQGNMTETYTRVEAK